MKKIFQILGKPSLEKADIGIEIECEGRNLQPVTEGYWTTERDGSLRGAFPHSSCEWVLAQPIPIGQAKAAIQQLAAAQRPDTELKFSFRTSVHVHVNVLPLTEDQLFSLIYTYLLLEEPLFDYCGAERKCNRFCLRLQDAEEIVENIQYMIKNGVYRFVRDIAEDVQRYSAINLAALRKYGSVEFRGMRGTLDERVLLNWCNALVHIRDYAMSKKDMLEVYQEFIRLGPAGFAEAVLKEYSKPFLSEKSVQDIQRSFSLSFDLPHYYNIYKEQYKQKEEEKAVEKPKKLAGKNIDGVLFDELVAQRAAEARFNPIFFAEPFRA